jgi:hypothetical protein
MRKYIASLCLTIIISLMITAGMLGRNKSDAHNDPSPQHAAMPMKDSSQDPPGTIDGAVTPQLIPDTTAYTLFFNFFADRKEAERGKLRSYCKHSALADVNLDGLLTAARFYKQQVADVDAQAEAVRNGEPPASAVAKLENLRKMREAIVARVMSKLPQFVGVSGAAAVRRHIEERIKPHTKIIPGPMMPN